MKGNESLRASQDLHVTRVLSFPNANEKVYFTSRINDIIIVDLI